MRTIETTVYRFDELSEDAKEEAINKHRACVDYPWFSECLDSLHSFCAEFRVKVTDYTLSDCHRAYIKTDVTPKHFRGLKLSSFDKDAMPTGFCFDADLRYSFYNEFKRTGDAFYAFQTALEEFLSSIREDIEWHYSKEAIIECFEFNGFEFTEEGEVI